MTAQHLEKEEEERLSEENSRATSPDSGYNKDTEDRTYDNRGFESSNRTENQTNQPDPSQSTGLTNLESGSLKNGRIRQRQLSNPATNGVAETPTWRGACT